MVRLVLAACALVGIIAVALAFAPRQSNVATAAAMTQSPDTGYTLHIDADYHFGTSHPSEIAHHWCKAVSPTLTECQLYDADGPKGQLVGVETIVPAAVWKTFPASEQKLWHYHKVELQKIHATLPDTPKDKQAAIINSIKETYGKVYILWDPMTSKYPMGQPSITVLK